MLGASFMCDRKRTNKSKMINRYLPVNKGLSSLPLSSLYISPLASNLSILSPYRLAPQGGLLVREQSGPFRKSAVNTRFRSCVPDLEGKCNLPAYGSTSPEAAVDC